MRDIKFRVWMPYSDDQIADRELNNDPIEQGFMTYTEYKEFKRDIGFMAHDDMFQLLHMSNPPKIEWMQYTGLKDKDKLDLYEGDIYNLGDKNIRYVIIFENGQFIGRQIGNRSLAGLYYWQPIIELMGNIHENPGLK